MLEELPTFAARSMAKLLIQHDIFTVIYLGFLSPAVSIMCFGSELLRMLFQIPGTGADFEQIVAKSSHFWDNFLFVLKERSLYHRVHLLNTVYYFMDAYPK